MALPSGLASLGRSLGISDADEGQPMDFYAWLATSEDVMKRVLMDTVPPELRLEGREQLPLVWQQVLRKAAPADSVSLAKGVLRMRNQVSSEVNLTSSTVSLSAGAPTRPLARWLSVRIYGEVNKANTERRRTRASNELRFLRDRVANGATILREAESRLTAFYNANRQPTLAPSLRFEEDRLRRQVDLARDTYLSLAKSAQEAELRAVRDIPALTMIDGPTIPTRRSKPRRLLIAATAALLAVALGYLRTWYRLEEGPAREAV